MSSYVTYSEFITSSYGGNVDITSDCSIFSSSGSVQEFLDYISGLIDLYAGRSFGTGVITDTFTASPGTNKIFARGFPVNDLYSITYYPMESPTVPVSVSTDTVKWFSNARIMFSENLYAYAVYEITYNAGYTTIPGPIKQATMMLAASYILAIENNAIGIPEGGNSTRFVFGDYEENFVDPRQRYDDLNVGIPVTIMAILSRYKIQN